MDNTKEKMYKELVNKYLDTTERSKVFADSLGDNLAYVYDINNSEDFTLYSNWQEVWEGACEADIREDIFNLGVENLPFNMADWNFILDNSPYLTRKLALYSLNKKEGYNAER